MCLKRDGGRRYIRDRKGAKERERARLTQTGSMTDSWRETQRSRLEKGT